MSVSGSQDLAAMVYIVYYGCFEAIENGIASIISFWQVRHWYIRNLLVLYVDFCVLLLCWKFSESAHRDNFTSPLVICAFSFHSPVFLL